MTRPLRTPRCSTCGSPLVVVGDRDVCARPMCPGHSDAPSHIDLDHELDDLILAGHPDLTVPVPDDQEPKP